MFEAEISGTAGSKRMELKPIQCLAIRLTLNAPIDFAFSSRFTVSYFSVGFSKEKF